MDYVQHEAFVVYTCINLPAVLNKVLPQMPLYCIVRFLLNIFDIDILSPSKD